jgi:hypothetical protein
VTDPAEQRLQQLTELIERRNQLARESCSLRATATWLDAEITALDEQIATTAG